MYKQHNDNLTCLNVTWSDVCFLIGGVMDTVAFAFRGFWQQIKFWERLCVGLGGGVDYLLLHAESFRLRLLSHLWQRWSLEDLVTNNNLVFSNIHLFIIYLLHLLFLLWKRTNNKGWIMAIMTQNICISTLTKWLRGVVVFHILLTSKRPLVWSREETKIPKNSNMWSYLLW